MKTISFQRYSTGLLLGLGLLLTGFTGTTRAAHAQAAPRFGSVDMGQVLSESKVRVTQTQELQGAVNNLRQVLQQLQQNNARFLTEAEIKELSGLYEKKTPTDSEKKRISALQDAAILKAGALNRLNNTNPLTEEQRREQSDLTQTADTGAQVLKGLSDEFTRRVNTRETELQGKLLTTIRTAIAKLAKEKELTVVFDSQVAYYTSNDITADVIKEINK